MSRKMSKTETEQIEQIIKKLSDKGIKVKLKDGHGNPSNPYWSTSFGKKDKKELVIR